MNWTHYILQVNIYLVVFYGFYKLLLDKETYFILNRIYLVSAGVLSLAIPFLRFEWFTTQSAAQPVYIGVDQLNQFINASVIQDSADRFSAGDFVALFYFGGVLFFVIRFIFQLFALRTLLKKTGAGSAFSFFNKKIIDNDLPQLQTIHTHEETHIRQLHTLDVLFFEVLGIVAWFNPIIYLYKNTIKNIHEYLADEEAARFQGDKKAYALLLLSSAFGITPNNLVNSFFNKSLIKKRIFMLHKQRSRKAAILKYGLFVPLFAVTLIMSSATIRNNEKIQQVADEIPLGQPLNAVRDVVAEAIAKPLKTGADERKATDETTKVADIDWKDFYNHLKTTVRYPAAAQEAKVEGDTRIKFTVKNGEVEGVSVADAVLGAGCDAEIMKNVLSYSKFESIPDGNYVFKTRFSLSDQDNESTALKNSDLSPVKGYIQLPLVIVGYQSKSESNGDGSEVYDFVSLDNMPTFPGGMKKFYEYLSKTVKYPKEAQDNNTQGKVLLSFIVEKDGSLTNIKVDRKLGSGTDEEAVRLLKASPKWVAGMQNGKKVRVKFNIPIAFSLNKNSITLPGDPHTVPPLYIIDGEKVKDFKPKDVDQDDIESIDVLKAATATALYGDAGKHGVIIITTKVKKAADSKKTELKGTKKEN